MKKLSLLVGALGGGLAGYLFSNKKLRDELANAEDAEEAAKLLGANLQKDGKKLAKQIQEFIDSEEVTKNVKKAKAFTQRTVEDAKKELNSVVNKGTAKAKKAAKKGSTKVKRAVKKGKTKAKKVVKKTTSTARKKAKSTARRMKTKVRRVS